jgi:hypothetical protein
VLSDEISEHCGKSGQVSSGMPNTIYNMLSDRVRNDDKDNGYRSGHLFRRKCRRQNASNDNVNFGLNEFRSGASNCS